eukprot:TRINITY_DN7317_c0_g3_i4.p1 TRINITY_DN7317_c0_g3~~TRINITY_DN7317_c0_g3_i4.p1  ORF type:complete len:388 (+),score=92.83 TRINITY_DN7317_c0_g3_i4:346-1509(+)
MEVNELLEETATMQSVPQAERRVGKKKRMQKEPSSSEEDNILNMPARPLYSLRPSGEDNHKLDTFFERTLNDTEDSSIKSERKEGERISSFKSKRKSRELLASNKPSTKFVHVESASLPLVNLKEISSLADIKISLSTKIHQHELPINTDNRQKYAEVLIENIRNDLIKKLKKQIKEMTKKDPEALQPMQIRALSKIPAAPLSKSSPQRANGYYIKLIDEIKGSHVSDNIWVLMDAATASEAAKKLSMLQDLTLCLAESFVEEGVKVWSLSEKSIGMPEFAFRILNASEYVMKVEKLIEFGREMSSDKISSLLHIGEVNPSWRAESLVEEVEREDILEEAESFCKKMNLNEEQGEVIFQCAKWFVKSLASNHPTIVVNGGFGCGTSS